MAGDINSIEFYQNIAKYKADKNQNGKIDDDEKDAYNNQMKQYDMNQDGKYDDTDVSLFKASVTYTDEEKAENKKFVEFYNKYKDEINSGSLSEQCKNEHDKIANDPNFKPEKDKKSRDFIHDVIRTLEYLDKNIDELSEIPKFYEYKGSFLKYLKDNRW